MILILAAALSGASCGGRAQIPLQHQIYIWQRVWTDRVTQAMERAAPEVAGWRVLVAETDRRGEWREFSPELATEPPATIPPGHSSSPTKLLTAVIRIDGQRRLEDASAVTAHIVAWTRAQPGDHWTDIEIDYDCPTRQLRAYTQFLESLRSELPPNLRLSLTALPT